MLRMMVLVILLLMRSTLILLLTVMRHLMTLISTSIPIHSTCRSGAPGPAHATHRLAVVGRGKPTWVRGGHHTGCISLVGRLIRPSRRIGRLKRTRRRDPVVGWAAVALLGEMIMRGKVRRLHHGWLERRNRSKAVLPGMRRGMSCMARDSRGRPGERHLLDKGYGHCSGKSLLERSRRRFELVRMVHAVVAGMRAGA